MKITDLTPYVVAQPNDRHWVFVKLETDEGLTGWGESGGNAAGTAQQRALGPAGAQAGPAGARPGRHRADLARSSTGATPTSAPGASARRCRPG